MIKETVKNDIRIHKLYDISIDNWNEFRVNFEERSTGLKFSTMINTDDVMEAIRIKHECVSNFENRL